MKKTNVFKVLALVALSSLSLMLTAQSKLDKQVLMTIGDTPVTVKEFCDVYTKNNLKSDVVDKKSVDEYLDLFTIFRMKVMEAHAMKLDTSAKFKREFEGYRKQLAKPYFTNDEISEELVEEAYQRLLKDVRASHILINCDKHALPSDTMKAYEKAMDIRKKALKGDDFGQLAVLYSQDPSARDMKATDKTPARKGNKGDLGYFTVFDMVYPFENGVYSLKEGEISMPVRSDFGYHIIKLNSITDALGTITAAHIFLQVPQDASDEDVQNIKDKADRIYEELMATNGANWKDMVLKYSEDNGTKASRGELTPFSVSRVVPQFIEAIKGLKPGEIAAPIRTNYGFHIVKLIKTSGVGTFQAEKDKLANRIEKDMRSKKSEEVVIEQIKGEYKFKANDKNVGEFIATIDSTILRAAYEPAANVDNDAELFRIGDYTAKVSDFISYIKAKQSPQRYVNVPTYSYQLYEAFQNQKILDYADAHLEEKYPEFKALVQEYNDGILLFDLMEKEVWNKAIVDTVGLKEFHARHYLDYMWGDRVQAFVVNVARPESVPAVKAYIEAGLPLDSLKVTMERDSVENVFVRKGFYLKGTNQYVDETEWKEGALKEFQPTVDKSTYFVKIIQVRKPEPKSFIEAKGLVTSDYQVELEENWIKELRKKYPVKVDQKVLEKVRKRYQ
ncbi:MAG: peptidylprolyl isomerase [Bacteroidales bacterium]|nr:peptidylprolyl isomerase [Bacteroidales bacterium]